MPEPGHEQLAPLLEVDDPRSHALGVEREPDDVDRRLEQPSRKTLGECPDRVVGRHQVPAEVDHQRGVRHVRGQDRLDGSVGLRHRRIGQLVHGVHRRVPAGEEHAVLLAQRHRELVAAAAGSSSWWAATGRSR